MRDREACGLKRALRSTQLSHLVYHLIRQRVHGFPSISQATLAEQSKEILNLFSGRCPHKLLLQLRQEMIDCRSSWVRESSSTEQAVLSAHCPYPVMFDWSIVLVKPLFDRGPCVPLHGRDATNPGRISLPASGIGACPLIVFPDCDDWPKQQER